MMEAKSSVDRLHDIVEKCYQEMSSRVHALELKELQRKSCALSIPVGEEAILDNTVLEHSQPALDPHIAAVREDSLVASEYVEELKRSWVYTRNSAFRVSTFSSDRGSTTWSCLSRLNMSEISTCSVINLAITLDDIENSQRSIQTWSNRSVGALWASQSHIQVLKPTRTSERQYPEGKRHAMLFKPDDDHTSYVMTATGGSRHKSGVSNRLPPVDQGELGLMDDPVPSNNGSKPLSHESDNEGSTPTAKLFAKEKFDARGDMTSIRSSVTKAFKEDYQAYPCKGCGEVLEKGKSFKLGGDRLPYIGFTRS